MHPNSPMALGIIIITIVSIIVILIIIIISLAELLAFLRARRSYHSGNKCEPIADVSAGVHRQGAI